MKLHLKLIVGAAVATLASVAASQSTTDSNRNTSRSATEATRDAGNAVGRAASAAVTPGDQNMGRNPENRSGGLMGNDRTGVGSTATTSGGRSAAQATRDAGNTMGRAADAAVTPGDQNLGNNPENRSGGLMGSDRTGTNANTGELRRQTRAARADRG